MHRPVRRYMLASLAVGALTALLLIFPAQELGPANLVMLYVPLVAAVALSAGRRAAAWASFLAFLFYNFFFVPPLYTLAVERLHDVTELLILLTVGLLVGTLVARARQEAKRSADQAERTALLYQVSQENSTALSADEILPRIARLALHLLKAHGASIRLIADDGAITYETVAGAPEPNDLVVWAPLATSHGTAGELRVWRGSKDRMPEDELRQLLATLASQAALAVERTRLAEAAAQTRLLRESERLKSTLLSSVSHDLRTPLAVIKGSVSNLLDEGVAWDARTTRNFLQTIDAEADRLNRLVRNLLEMSKLEAGAFPRSCEALSISDIVGPVLSRLRPLLKEHQVAVILPAGLPDVRADPVQIELVVTNLLENAAKYAPAGSPIDVAAESSDGMVTVSVADRGPGIPAGDEERIFGKFYQAASSTHKPAGSGLGLAIAKGIVEAHDGRIAAMNRPGGGAMFRFSLPRLEERPARRVRDAQAA